MAHGFGRFGGLREGDGRGLATSPPVACEQWVCILVRVDIVFPLLGVAKIDATLLLYVCFRYQFFEYLVGLFRQGV